MTCQAIEELRRAEKGRELNRLLDLPYHFKLKATRYIIQKALKEHRNPLVASSFGKDSTVLLHLVLTFMNVPVVWNNTGCEFKGNIKLKNKLQKEWDLTIHELRPGKFDDGKKITFWSCAKRYGYPKESRGKTHGAPKCCYHLKEGPAIKFYRQYEDPIIFVGLTGDEGRARRWGYILKGSTIYYSESYEVWKCTPLIFWKKSDIDTYISQNKLPVSEAYSEFHIDRTGCMWCTGHYGWPYQVFTINPKVYIMIRNDMGQKTLLEYI
jgi:3'-phosphoadenosine 5'-phosphosulfate sulfotransferase (PAPS reductase)/FAD synthetase